MTFGLQCSSRAAFCDKEKDIHALLHTHTDALQHNTIVGLFCGLCSHVFSYKCVFNFFLAFERSFFVCACLFLPLQVQTLVNHGVFLIVRCPLSVSIIHINSCEQ